MMKTHVQQWGNSLAVRIPKTLIEEAGLYNNAEVELSLRNGEIILTPRKQRRYTLESLLEGMTEDNRHDEWDMGADVGKEVWE